MAKQETKTDYMHALNLLGSSNLELRHLTKTMSMFPGAASVLYPNHICPPPHENYSISRLPELLIDLVPASSYRMVLAGSEYYRS